MADGKVPNDPLLNEIGARHKKTAAQIALRWVVQQGVVTLSKTVSETRARKMPRSSILLCRRRQMTAIHGLHRKDGRIVSPAGLAPAWDAA